MKRDEIRIQTLHCMQESDITESQKDFWLLFHKLQIDFIGIAS